ncbi:MAG: hypothetical protein ABW221_20565 [Vicinamibacteria bacterium]
MPETTTVLALLAAAALADPVAPVSPAPVAAGSWGGAHAQLEVKGEETRVELDCARGVLPGVLAVGKNGAVDALGTLVRHGARAETDAGEGEPARFRGTLAGKTLTLTVTLVGPSQDLGTFRLKQGQPGRLAACPVPPAG